MPTVDVKFNNGLNTSRDRSDLDDGELVTATGIEYMPGDPVRAWKVKGRSAFSDTSSAAKIKGVALALFDSGGTDRLLALSGTTVYSATPGSTGTFSSLITGLDSSTSTLSAAHWNDRWYLADGVDKNRVVESDGTVRTMGMVSPQTAPIATAQTTQPELRPTASGSTFTNPELAYDTSLDRADYLDSYASGTLSAAGTTTETYTTFSGTTTTSSHKLYVKWGLAAAQIRDNVVDGPDRSTSDAGFDVSVTITWSENGGTTFPNTLATYSNLTSAQAATTEFASVTDALTLETDVQVKCSMTYNSGTTTATLRIYDIRVSAGGSTVQSASANGGHFYAISEYDASRGLESPVGAQSNTVTLDGSTHTSVGVTLPAAAQNSTTTHFRVYRTVDGGAAYQLGLIGSAAAGEASNSFIDTFDTWTADQQAIPLRRMLTVTEAEATTRYDLDNEPPAFAHLNVFQGSLVGLRSDQPRNMRYTPPGIPESWPEIYVFDKFPLEERDQLIATVTVGDVLLVAAQGAMIRGTALPLVDNNLYRSPEFVKLSGHPGCVGRYAITAYSVAGESRAAWVSRYGIYITNGVQSHRITDDLDWASTVSVANLSTSVLHWDKDRLVLIFAYDSDGGGTNDRYLLIHMDPVHRKPNGQPKITGPHYGSINCMASGEVSGVQRIYSGHVSDGIVYLENNGNTDASNAYDSSGTVPLSIKTGRRYGPDRRDLAFKDASYRHTDWGSGQTATISFTVGRDTSNNETLSKTLALSSQKGEQVWIGRSGEFFEIQIDHTGSARGAIQDARHEVRLMGSSGEANP